MEKIINNFNGLLFTTFGSAELKSRKKKSLSVYTNGNMPDYWVLL